MAHQYFFKAKFLSAKKTSIITDIQYLPPYKIESFLQQKYLVEKLSARQISEQIFSARSTVLKHLKQFRITLRPEDEALEINKGQLGYGEKRRNGQISGNKRELEILEKMKALRGQGFSYWKIAEILTAMGIPTKTRKSGWKAATVMKILKGNLT